MEEDTTKPTGSGNRELKVEKVNPEELEKNCDFTIRTMTLEVSNDNIRVSENENKSAINVVNKLKINFSDKLKDILAGIAIKLKSGRSKNNTSREK